MNILIIGNGFDLAHGLPTRYTDFLKFCIKYNEEGPVSDCSDINEEFASFRYYNFWLRYFYRKIPDVDSIDDINENTWIDFEKEIAETVKKIEQSEIEISSSKEIVSIIDISKDNSIFKEIFDECESFDCDEDTFDNFLYSQLKKFVRAFEIYCVWVNKIEIDKSQMINMQRKKDMEEAKLKVDSYSHQARNASGYIGRQNEVAKFENLRAEAYKRYSMISSEVCYADYLDLSLFNCVLSFNYTNTYERLYGNDKTKYCYIHGKAQNDKEKTNIILGIDDDLPPSEQSKNFRWIRFKKFYQRIIFKTGSEYKDWFDSKQEKTNIVHIVGHSLDRTDYDVLYEIFDSSISKIIIYYYNQEDFEDKVQKVIQLLAYKGKNGRDELIRRVHGSKWSIKFVDQYDEKEGVFIRPFE